MVHSLFNSQLPLWYQVAQSLRAEILSSIHTEPLRIPTEIDLAEKYGVSVITIRQSLKSLQQDGLIYRQRRHGTFAHPNPMRPSSLHLLGLTESVIAQYVADNTIVLSRTEVVPPHSVAHHFAGVSKVIEFQRTSGPSGDISAYLINYIHPEVGQSITTEMASGMMTKAIQDLGTVTIRTFQNALSAILPTPHVAEKLKIDLMTPVLFFEGFCIDTDNRVLDAAQIYYRADRYKFSMQFDVPV
jgi:GntR family transcriptional regulator